MGVCGLSLGGALAATLTCLEPGFAFSAPFIAHMDLGALLADAPVLSAMRFKEEDEVITMANNTKFGLGAGLFTENLARAHRVSGKIRSGILWINTYRAISPIAPFGGFGHSGFGREAGVEALLDYTRTKTVWINTSSEPMANPFIMR